MMGAKCNVDLISGPEWFLFHPPFFSPAILTARERDAESVQGIEDGFTSGWPYCKWQRPRGSRLDAGASSSLN